jgi:AraC-like DNA-binding protein
MKNSDLKYQPNLAIREFNLSAGEEWVPRLAGWSLIQVRRGHGYCLRPGLNQELVTGTVLLLAGRLPGSIRASQLGELSLCSFSVIPERLTALTTLDEQDILKLPANDEPVFKILPPDNQVAAKMSGLLTGGGKSGLLLRLKLLQLFAELFLDELKQDDFKESKTEMPDAIQRLQEFLQELPASDLLELDFKELAVQTHCTERHLSRVFQKVVGMSFTDKRAELRLIRAEELLATTNSKVVQVALESGYNSLSQFNLMFIRRYGISPGKWRRKNSCGNVKGNGKKSGQRSDPAKSLESASRHDSSLQHAGKRTSMAASGQRNGN